MNRATPARRFLLICACLVLALTSMPRSQERFGSQEAITAALAQLALAPVDDGSQFACGSPRDFAIQSGLMTMVPLPSGEPVRGDRFPRIIRPGDLENAPTFGFNNLLIIGDHEAVTFWRADPDAEGGSVQETWTRTGTQTVAGQLVSVFNPTWDMSVLRQRLRRQFWGHGNPAVYLGDIAVPGGAGFRAVRLAMAPSGIPSQTFSQNGDDIQYGSHSVNIWDPTFGDSRVMGGQNDWDVERITNKVYEHFRDDYDLIAVVSQATQLADFDGFHRNVKNDIGGIGLQPRDDTALYGSGGFLKGTEGYPNALWGDPAVALHEALHQLGEYSGVWANVGPPTPTIEGVIDRQGHAPDTHTPLLTPGEVANGAVLFSTRRVVEQSPGSGTYQIEVTTPTVVYNPITAYRMGHLALEDLPEYRVFENQGQFNATSTSRPDAGTVVEGASFPVVGNDFLAADGVRTGRVVSNVKRLLVYVSRAGLVPAGEMDVINSMAARFDQQEGVTNYFGFESLSQTTGGKAVMTAQVDPKPEPDGGTTALGVQTATKIEPGPPTQYPDVPADTFNAVGFRIDNAIPGRVRVGDRVQISGTLTRDDEPFDQVCFKLDRYGATDNQEHFECVFLDGNRFDLGIDIVQPGHLRVQPFAFVPDSGPQFPYMAFTGIIAQPAETAPVAAP